MIYNIVVGTFIYAVIGGIVMGLFLSYEDEDLATLAGLMWPIAVPVFLGVTFAGSVRYVWQRWGPW